MMKGMTPRRMADACGGILQVPADRPELADEEITSITTDSRKAEPACAFAAIKGERVDGHSFIPAVLEKGASCVIAEQPPAAEITGCWIRVPSTGGALKCIAQYYLEQMNIPVVGIAGSVGKTSTKEMVASVLSQKYRTLKTLGNFNNELGLPLTVFRLREGDEMAVLEMGISNFGEMHRLARVAKPDTCVMTNIGTCHLEFLGDRDGVLRAKTEIFDFLKSDGHIVLNGNDDKLRTIQSVNGVQPVYYGLPEQEGGENLGRLDVWADSIRTCGLDGTQCRIHTPQGDIQVKIPIPGRHMVMNSLAAATVGLIYGLTLGEIRDGIASVEPVNGRVHIIHSGSLTIIDDCYNANPMSMKASLGLLRDAEGKRTAILGDMAELGADEKTYHEEVGAFAASCGIDHLIAVGERSADMARVAKEAGTVAVSYFLTAQELLDHLTDEIQEKETILVKASNCMHFGRIVQALQELQEGQE